ncbi:iron-containing alcohol dehydrogenase [Cupriavidus sp. 8B]
MDFLTTPRVILKAGATCELAPVLIERGYSRILVVTDHGVVRAGIVGPMIDALKGAGLDIAVFDQVEPDPPVAVVNAAVEAASDSVDCVIGIGGGSTLDTAKLVAYLLASPCDPETIFGVSVAAGDRLPLLLVPTTAGTGSEVTPIAIVTSSSGEKKGIVAPQLLPDIAILDPLNTLTMPRAATAATAIDAMVHAIEAYTGKLKKNPFSDALAREALRLLVDNLPIVLSQPEHLEGRSNMLLGACLAGMAFANSPVGAVHALAYPLGARHHVAHGLSNALMLRVVMDFNMGSAGKAYAELGDYLGKHGGGAKGLQRALDELLVGSGLPASLSAVGIRPIDLPLLANDAMQQQRLLINNPRNVTYEDALHLYEAVL